MGNNENGLFEIKDNTVDVEKIMEEIKSNIKARGMEEVDFPDTLSLVKRNEVLSSINIEDDWSVLHTDWGIVADRPITSHRKVLGPIIVFFKKAIRKCLRWYINPMVDQQRNYNAAVTRLIDNINGKASAAENKLMDMEDVVSELQKDVDDISSRLLTLEDNVRWLNSIAQDGKEAAMVSAERLRRIEGALKKEGRIAMNAPINHTEREDVDIDYFLFEQIHRGSREQIKTSQEKYLKYFEDKDNILDIGCGRGEFIELLIENGKKNVRGIDVNDDMVLYCKELGLPVEKADAIEYLENIETGKIQGIYMGQVVEHLSPADMLYIIRLAYRKLAKDGVLIIETLNPRCLAIFSNAFYVDISHEKPVHPFTLEFIFQTEGFKNLEVIYMSEIKEKIPEIKDSRIVNVEEFNKAISRVNDLLFGYQDYAIIGRK